MTECQRTENTNSQAKKTKQVPKRISVIKHQVVKLQSFRDKYVLTD